MRKRSYRWYETKFEVVEESKGRWSVRPAVAIERAHFREADIRVNPNGEMEVRLTGDNRESVEEARDVESALRAAAASLSMQRAKTAQENTQDMEAWMAGKQ